MATKSKKPRKPPRVVRPRAPKLTAKQRAADKNPLYNPVQQLAGHRLSDAADAVVAAEFGPKLAAIGRQARSTETQGTALMGHAADYYRQLAEQEAGNVARQQAISSRLTGAVANAGAASQGAVDKAAQDEQAREQADAALRGGGLSGGGDQRVAEVLAAQRAAAAQTNQQAASSAAEQNANFEALQALAGTARQLRGGEIQGQLANRLANSENELRAQRSDLEAQRGDERVKQILDMRQKGFDNLVTQQGLGIKQSELDAQISNQTAQQRLAQSRINATIQNNEATQKTARARVRAQLRGQDISSSDRKLAVQQRREAAQLRADGQKKGTKSKDTAASLKTKRAIQNTQLALQQGHSVRWLQKNGAAPDVIQAAQDLEKYGYLPYDTYNLLKRAGVQLPKEWRPPSTGQGFGPH